MNEKEKKKYVIPELELIRFTNDEIITASGELVEGEDDDYGDWVSQDGFNW